MKLLFILSFLFSILSQCHVLTIQSSPTVLSKSLESSNPVRSLGNANDGALELCQNNFPDGKLNPTSSHYINDGCSVVCLLGLDEWHKLPNQIGNLCPFNLRGTCDTDGRCHNEGPVKLGYVGMDILNLIFINFLNIPAMDMYFVVAHIRNSSEPWPLASMDYTDSAAHCNTRSSPGPIYPIWDQHCDIPRNCSRTLPDSFYMCTVISKRIRTKMCSLEAPRQPFSRFYRLSRMDLLRLSSIWNQYKHL